ncbi:RNA methyltransferase [Pseudoalteromonas luteoviolacea]|uniref:23S rRNA methyltransferase n=1 Tax=Pseudoalteromonas luteoviolacea DSM 6061 TaxID=1365250 RepID=A0A166WUK0_9GAMM|nr:RNA methyltransferase [Pseudoalteromonas luteoviolacea]KZN38095.1 23S rRNA methyltransferase [Pseudoalteromonas luteoviolacea DSM 6061]KZN54420.1 23S rRNA methyltransferase [Pseudoalteromonas luteoviolacea CPMOR-2]TQF70261.1 RNA methyltransferase [Pseudoalteromonas luteoviolacea]
MSESYSAIGLVNPKSPTNVGGVLRAAGCYGAQAVYFSGNRYAKAAKYHTDTKNIADNIPIEQVDDFKVLKTSNRALVCVELVEGAIPLPEFKHPEDALYVFGPEDGSLPQSIVDVADAVVYVPTTGCMNLAATVNVLLYDRMAKRTASFDSQQVLTSRDTNNRLTVG